REYVRVLHLAVTTSEAEVESALQRVLDAGTVPTFDAVRELVCLPQPATVPQLRPAPLDLAIYDRLLPSHSAFGQAVLKQGRGRVPNHPQRRPAPPPPQPPPSWHGRPRASRHRQPGPDGA